MVLARAVASYIASPHFVSDPMSIWRPGMRAILAAVGSVSLLVALGGCGPPLTDPSSLDITGVWTSSNKIGPLSGIHLNVTQRADGTLLGQWSGVLSPPNAVCPPGLGANPVGQISGTNTVLQIQISLLGAGSFAGQETDGQTLEGSVLSCGQLYRITFLRLDAPTTGAIRGSVRDS